MPATSTTTTLNALHSEPTGSTQIETSTDVATIQPDLIKRNPALFVFKGVATSTMREGVLQFRYWRNRCNGVPSLLRKDKDDTIASTAAGAVMGAGFGWMRYGSAASPAGALMYGLIAYSVQWGLCISRNVILDTSAEIYRKRQQHALKPHLAGNEELELHSGTITTPEWWTSNWRNKDDDFSTHANPNPNWDPLKDAINWMVGHVRRRIDLGPEYSPLYNAFNLEYRKTLNTKVEILKFQIEALRHEIKQLEISTGRTVASLASSKTKN
ncbi:hypothetical protein BSLG_003488 [Batrachochytrium salamandrivorans]|nr:hypothetical protein BSLG_003488 [Batrachochytrium salamandrivorans]